MTFDSIPTLEHVKGLAVYGPSANLFTLGATNTVQQFDLNSPAIMTTNVQHPAPSLPPSPPNSIEEPTDASQQSGTTIIHSESETSSIPIEMGVSESDDDHLSPFARIQRGAGGHESSGNEMPYESTSPVSSRSEMSMRSKSSTGDKTPARHPGSMRSRGMTENTYISTGSSLRTPTAANQYQSHQSHQPRQARELDNVSMGYSLGSTSVASSSRSHRPSRLRNEVPRSPDDNKVHDLFKYTRTRLSDIPYKHPNMIENGRMTNDDLRRQMLSTIFGWHSSVEDLVRDEMSRHPAGSPSRIMLAKWLGDVETDVLAASSQNMTSSDWMILALSGIGGQASQHKLGQAYVQRLLEGGDVHVAVTIMLGMGDHNDAIEAYISHKRYMEALILTCVCFPSVWERQVAIIKKWGEWAVQHGQQQLAIRCFSCAGQESSEPWTSPSAAQLTFGSISDVLSPPLSPPGQRGPQRSIAKTSALKLITSFGDQTEKAKFYAQDNAGATPLAAGATPIADTAMSPANPPEVTTAFLRPTNNSRFNTPTSARPSRSRLPSVGEGVADEVRAALHRNNLPTDESEASEQGSRTGHARKYSYDRGRAEIGSAVPRTKTASPNLVKDRRMKQAAGYSGERPPSPDQMIMNKMQQSKGNLRNGSRDRIPQGINLRLGLEPTTAIEVASPEPSVASSTRGFHWPSRTRRGPGSVTSASSTGRRAYGKTQEDHISSLDTASQYSRRARSRHASKERAREQSRGRQSSREREYPPRGISDERGRASARTFTSAKRSPTSPVPMSPEDLANLGTPPIAQVFEQKVVGKVSSRASSRTRRQSPEGRPRPPALDIRGRSGNRADSHHLRSPSSPLPLSASTLHFAGSEDEEDYKAAVAEREMFRAKHSRSRGLPSPATTLNGAASESGRMRAEEAADVLKPMTFHTRAVSTEHAGDLRTMKDDRMRKKQQAARDLEERRRSLAKRPSAPSIPHPDQFSPMFRVGIEAADERLPDHVPTRSATEPPRGMNASSRPMIGLPATPKAMRLIMESDKYKTEPELPEVPPIPATFAQRHSPKYVPTTPKRTPSPKSRAEPESDPEMAKIHREPERIELQAPPDSAPLTLLPSTVYPAPFSSYDSPQHVCSHP